MGFFGGGGGAAGNVALPIDEFIPSTVKVQSGRFNTFNIGGITTKNHAANYILWAPVYLPETKNYTTAYIWVTSSAASSEVKIAFYKISSAGLPSDKLLETSGIATTSTGLKSISVTSTLLDKGWVLAAIASNGSQNFSALSGGSIMGFISGFNAATYLSFNVFTYANSFPNPWSGAITDSADSLINVGLK